MEEAYRQQRLQLISTALRNRANQQQQSKCAVCLKEGCNLQTHKAFMARQRLVIDAQDEGGTAQLMKTSFSSSYVFNPLSAAIAYVNGQVEVNLDDSILREHANFGAALHKLIAYDIGRNTPFTDPAGREIGAVAAEWLAATAVDEIACTSTLNLWVNIEWTNTQKPDLARYSSGLTSLFLKMLRSRVESNEPVSAGTIFAASNHFASCLIFLEQDKPQMDAMMDGVEALVNAAGGFSKIADTTHPGLAQSLLWNDVLYAWNTGARPRFYLKNPPEMPPSLAPERSQTFAIPLLYYRCCGVELLDPARYLKMFLLFRHGDDIRPLSEQEYQYLVTLERYVHVQLLEQQARYHETDSMSECIVLALGLMRMNVLCVWEQHVRVRRAHVKRLNRALQAIPLSTWTRRRVAKALVWVCWVLLAQTEMSYDQPVILGLVERALRSIWGDDELQWPADWHTSFANRLEPLLWHQDYDAQLHRVSRLIEDFMRT